MEDSIYWSVPLKYQSREKTMGTDVLTFYKSFLGPDSHILSRDSQPTWGFSVINASALRKWLKRRMLVDGF